MKFFKLIVIVTAALAGFIACQKELDYDFSVPSTGTLVKDASGNCMPAPVTGIYQKDTALNNYNFVDITVKVTEVGTYEIKTDTINGYSFQVHGTFGTTGTQIVRLFGTGKPLAAGVNSFTVTYGTSTCVFDVTVIGAGGGAATYTLGGAPLACSGFTLGTGTYTAGQILVPANIAITNVNVTGAGTYDLGTDTVNGIYFRAVGVFTTTTPQSITLSGSGTPLAAGTFTYHLTNGNTTCTFTITVGGSGTAADYVLGGSPDNCTGVLTHGVYKQGVSVGGNSIEVDVTVNTVGTYTLTTFAVNGVSFSASGTFTATGGPQKVTLNASGIPTNQGAATYEILGAAGTKCKFVVTYDPATVTPSGNIDYIPQTTGSNWSTKLVGGNPEDTTYMEVSPNSKTLSGNAYKIFELKEMGTPTDSLYFRKEALGKYYQYFDEDFGLLDAPYQVDQMVLDSTKNIGYTWTQNLPNNTAAGGTINITLARIEAEITGKGATETVEGITYTNVIKVTYKYKATLGPLGPTDIGIEVRWFAKGYGLIYDEIDAPIAGVNAIINTTRTQIF